MNPDLMREALALARQGVGRVSPNPAVGAVVASGGSIVGRGFHTWAGVRHAEVIALEEAGEAARGADLYVTLEPCSHTGRTPPCVDAIVRAGVARVFSITEDPNPLVSGRGFARLREAGVEVALMGEFVEEARRLNLAFFHFMRTGRPLVTLKSALTLDGKIAAPEDNTGWITSERARAHVQLVRHEHDAILTGINTVLGDDCLLNDRSGLQRARPLLRIVLDSLLRLPPESRMVRSCRNDVLAVCTSVAPAARRTALEERGVEVVALDGEDGRPDLRRVVALLAERNYLSLMIEAGSKVNWSALESGAVDRILFYYAPKILGGIESLPVAGGLGRRRRSDAILFHNVRLSPIPPDEFLLEAWLTKDQPFSRSA
jgi:diaminohydroxyphosphoribosylaminopyrimidine deaminase/5-amino-6-(5-phosphoribosylamino)uracil reductase